MALKKLLAQRLFGKSRLISSAVTNCRVSSPCTAALSKVMPSSSNKLASDPGDDGIFRRYLHRQSGAASAGSGLRFLPTGQKLLETIREMDIARGRVESDGARTEAAAPEVARLTVKDAAKILKVSQLEFIKARLRGIEKDHISYSELVQICSTECSSEDHAIEFAKMLDQSGSVIVLGNIVYIRPEQEIEPNVWHPDLFKRDGDFYLRVVKAIQSLIPVSPYYYSPNDPTMIQEMEKQKAAIDREARTLVQRELWCGLGYFVVQTAVFMRLTFWELSWDVMEPICFFVTSLQFMAGYAFFLRTSREPSFEGFFHSRFLAKQKQLMKAQNFDVNKYNELMRIKGSKSNLSERDRDAAFAHSPAAMQ